MANFNFRFVLKTLGFLLLIESLFMMTAAIVAFYYHDMSGDAILTGCAVTLVSGMLLRLIGFQEYERPIGKRESFLLVALTWVVLSAFGMLPYWLSGVLPNVSDAFFETMSGFTTTGSSTITNVEIVPRGILFWRSLTQWIGGIGIIVFALALLPILGGNAAFLYDAETTGITHDKFRPRVTQVAKRLWITYLLITGILIVLLYAGPMDMFDSVCHAMATLSTGGYSTKQASIAYWNSPYLEYVIGLFMFIGGINFSLIYLAFQGQPQKLFKDEEFRWYFFIVLSFVALVAVCLCFSGIMSDVEKAFRTSLFQIIAVMTTTGFTTADYTHWGAFYSLVICLLMLFCACAGSTSGGMKVVRLVILCKNALNEFKLQVHPNAILPVRLNDTVVPVEVVTKMLAFMFLYLAILVFSFLILSFTGMGFEESVSSAVSCMGNVGPGLGSLSPSGHYADVPDFSKWYLSFLMLTGRLELFTVLSLFMPAFWKR
ncbi:MAG: TrkH family potassium uptake protein [Prevotella sp.]|jgi:trk system potassium uptake protein TrkH|nr:TrkH family potassium uptake protein [Prevotella sp.]